jgi:hypothetical protein
MAEEYAFLLILSGFLFGLLFQGGDTLLGNSCDFYRNTQRYSSGGCSLHGWENLKSNKPVNIYGTY